MQEASQLLGKMKDMPGMGDIQSMMQKMGMGGGGRGRGGGIEDMLAGLGGLGGLAGLAGGAGGAGGGLNLGAMTNRLNQDMKQMENKEKMLQRANIKRAEMEKIKLEQQKMAALPPPPTKQLTDQEMEELVFSIEGDKPEKSMRNDKPTNNSNKKKKKKGKEINKKP